MTVERAIKVAIDPDMLMKSDSLFYEGMSLNSAQFVLLSKYHTVSVKLSLTSVKLSSAVFLVRLFNFNFLL